MAHAAGRRLPWLGRILSGWPLPSAGLDGAPLQPRPCGGPPGYPQEPRGWRAFGVGSEICSVVRNPHQLLVAQPSLGGGERGHGAVSSSGVLFQGFLRPNCVPDSKAELAMLFEVIYTKRLT